MGFVQCFPLGKDDNLPVTFKAWNSAKFAALATDPPSELPG